MTTVSGAHHVVWFDSQLHGYDYYGYYLAKSYESALDYYNSITVSQDHAKVIVGDTLKQ